MTATIDELKQMLEAQYAHFTAELAESPATAHEGMGYGTHQADDATEAAEQLSDMALRQNAEHLLYEVERALYRMDQGTYGKCQHCGELIDMARLEAIPYARYCIEHADMHEG